jgi:hypothetical protein
LLPDNRKEFICTWAQLVIFDRCHRFGIFSLQWAKMRAYFSQRNLWPEACLEPGAKAPVKTVFKKNDFKYAQTRLWKGNGSAVFCGQLTGGLELKSIWLCERPAAGWTDTSTFLNSFRVPAPRGKGAGPSNAAARAKIGLDFSKRQN